MPRFQVVITTEFARRAVASRRSGRFRRADVVQALSPCRFPERSSEGGEHLRVGSVFECLDSALPRRSSLGHVTGASFGTLFSARLMALRIEQVVLGVLLLRLRQCVAQARLGD